MRPEYFLRTPEGREGPYFEEDLLDLLDGGKLSPETMCEIAATGELRRVGELFEVISPPDTAGAPPSSGSAGRGRELPESSLHLGHPSLLVYWKSWLAITILLWLGLNPPATARHLPGLQAPAATPALLLAAAGLALTLFLRRSRFTHVVTSRRVALLTGLVSRNLTELPISNIDSITVTKTGFLGLLGIGTVRFYPADDEEPGVRFVDAPGAARIAQLVREMQAAAD